MKFYWFEFLLGVAIGAALGYYFGIVDAVLAVVASVALWSALGFTKRCLKLRGKQ